MCAFQIGYESDVEGALITYAEAVQAMAAFKSRAPILNNRFIRVFFYGDTEQLGGPAAAAGGGGGGAEAGAARPAPFVRQVSVDRFGARYAELPRGHKSPQPTFC